MRSLTLLFDRARTLHRDLMRLVLGAFGLWRYFANSLASVRPIAHSRLLLLLLQLQPDSCPHSSTQHACSLSLSVSRLSTLSPCGTTRRTQIHQNQNNAQNKNSYRVPQNAATISPPPPPPPPPLTQQRRPPNTRRSLSHASHPRVQDGDRVVREARGDLRALRVPADLKYPSLPSIRLDERAVLHVPNMQTLVKRAGGEELAIG